MQLMDLVGRDLAGFKIEKLTEVLKTNEDGRTVKSIGFFRDEDVARGFAAYQSNPLRCGRQNVFVLTNGKEGLGSVLFLVGSRVTLLDDEKAALEILKHTMARLSSEEKAILGL